MDIATPSPSHRSRARSAAALILAICISSLLASPVVAEVRISEILANPFGSNDGRQSVELQNFGTTAADISGWRVSNEFESFTFPAELTLDPGEILVLRIASTGANTANEIHTGEAFPPLGVTQGSFALYGATGTLLDPDAIMDFVEWGAGDQLGEMVAAEAGVWPAGDFVPLTSEGNSIQLCNRQVKGVGAWLEGDGDTLGGVNNCSTPVTSSTWGKVKGIYR